MSYLMYELAQARIADLHREAETRRRAELVDGAADQPSNPANTLSASLDVTKCLAAAGPGFAVGATAQLLLLAGPQTGGEGQTWQTIALKRVS